MFFKNNNIGIRKITVLRNERTPDNFEENLKMSKVAKFMIKEVMNKLAFVISRWSEEYIDDDGEVQQMVLKGYPMEALQECLRGFTLLFLALPDWFRVTEEERIPLTQMINELLIKGEKQINATVHINGTKTGIISKVRYKKRTKDEDEFIRNMRSIYMLIAHDVTEDAIRYLKGLEIILTNSEENLYIHDVYNSCSAAMMIYMNYIDKHILFSDEYNRIMYGVEPRKTSREKEYEIEQSYIVK